jgi:CO dehydrogenase/acetyl-CoA synthase beta subunit
VIPGVEELGGDEKLVLPIDNLRSLVDVGDRPVLGEAGEEEEEEEEEEWDLAVAIY